MPTEDMGTPFELLWNTDNKNFKEDFYILVGMREGGLI